MGWNSSTNQFCWTASIFWDGVFWGLCDLSMFPAKTMVVCEKSDPLFPVYTGITRIKCLKEVKTLGSLGKTPPKRVFMMVWGSQTLPPKKCSSLGLIGQFCPDSTRVTKTVLKMYMLYKKEVGNQQERLQQGKKKKWHSSNWLILSWGSKLPFFPYNRG